MAEIAINTHPNQTISQNPEDSKNSVSTTEQKTVDVYLQAVQLLNQIRMSEENDAWALQAKLKERMASMQDLTTLLQKVNQTEKNKDLDFTNNPEGRALVDKARELGVQIPEGKYKWKKEEIAALAENIKMVKDNADKISQMDRLELNRLLQEAADAYKLMSQILAMRARVAETIIRNFHS